MLIIYITNDRTAKKPLGNYVYQVKVNARDVARGEIKGHNKDDGWKALVKMLLNRESIISEESDG